MTSIDLREIGRDIFAKNDFRDPLTFITFLAGTISMSIFHIFIKTP